MTTSHPEFEQLADYVDGRLDPATAADVAAHVDSCPQCTADVAWLRATTAQMRQQAAWTPPPDAVRQRVVAAFDAARPAPRRSPAGWLAGLAGALTPQRARAAGAAALALLAVVLFLVVSDGRVQRTLAPEDNREAAAVNDATPMVATPTSERPTPTVSPTAPTAGDMVRATTTPITLTVTADVTATLAADSALRIDAVAGQAVRLTLLSGSVRLQAAAPAVVSTLQASIATDAATVVLAVTADGRTSAAVLAGQVTATAAGGSAETVTAPATWLSPAPATATATPSPVLDNTATPTATPDDAPTATPDTITTPDDAGGDDPATPTPDADDDDTPGDDDDDSDADEEDEGDRENEDDE